jgi:hypothetical protein
MKSNRQTPCSEFGQKIYKYDQKAFQRLNRLKIMPKQGAFHVFIQ